MIRSGRTALIVVCLVLVPATPQAAPPPDADSCIECHGADGMGQGKSLVPVIAGMPAGHIEEAIFAYIDGARNCDDEPKMCETVAALSADEVTELANYFAALPRVASSEEFDPELAGKGESLHNEHCSVCHLRPDDERAKFGLGIPLHGQRKDYLRYALTSYFNGNREALLQPMAHELQELTGDDVDALIEYFVSYSPVGD